MTTQEAYEAIRAHFSQPDARLGKNEGGCLYVTADGDKCAVGCLIPQKILDVWGEKLNTVGSLPSFSEENDVYVDDSGEYIQLNPFEDIDGLKDLLNGDSDEGRRKFEFLRMAQTVHDSRQTNDAETFVQKLDCLALGFGLAIEDNVKFQI